MQERNGRRKVQIRYIHRVSGLCPAVKSIQTSLKKIWKNDDKSEKKLHKC